MKLVTYESENVPRAGIVVDKQVLEIAALLGERGGLRDVRALLELPNDPLARLKSALSSARAELGVPLDKVRLRAPILQPPTVRDFMVYEGHASGGGTRQLSNAWYRLPIFTSLTRFVFSVHRTPFPIHPLLTSSTTSWSWRRSNT